MADRIEISISLPARLVAAVDLHFYDPALGKPKYGARSRLIAQLLTAWLGGLQTDARRTVEYPAPGRPVEGHTEFNPFAT